MPYIKPDERPQFDPLTEELASKITSVGQLNYVITSLCHHCTKRLGLNYEVANSIDGVLGCVQKEYYRKIVGPYEEKKILLNGDIGILIPSEGTI